MASVKILSANSGVAKKATQKDYARISLTEISNKIDVSNIAFDSKLRKAIDYSIIDIHDMSSSVAISDISPFRIKFSNIGIIQYPSGTAAPIGIAIIGFNNLIL